MVSSQFQCRTGVLGRTIHRNLLFIVAVLVTPLVLPSVMRAQLNTGRISGQITDQSGAASAKANVSMRDQETGIARTAVKSHFRHSNLCRSCTAVPVLA